TRKNRPQAHIILLAWRLDLTHHFESCRHQEGVTYSVPRHQIKGVSRIEFAHPVRYDGHAVVPTRKQYVIQPANPGPICRGPETVVGLGEVLVIKLNRRQMPEQDTVCMQGAFRWACRARRVNEECGVIGGRNYWGKNIRRVGEEALVVQDALSISSVNTDDM